MKFSRMEKNPNTPLVYYIILNIKRLLVGKLISSRRTAAHVIRVEIFRSNYFIRALHGIQTGKQVMVGFIHW